MATPKPKPILYGAEWCPKTSGFRNYLQSNWVDFEYKNIEQDPAAEQAVKDMNGGKVKFPMVVIGEKKLLNPHIPELNDALNEHGLLE